MVDQMWTRPQESTSPQSAHLNRQSQSSVCQQYSTRYVRARLL